MVEKTTLLSNFHLRNKITVMSFVLHMKAMSLHIKYDSMSSLTFKLLCIILLGPGMAVNIDMDNKTEGLQGDHLKENMPMAESRIPDRRSSNLPCLLLSSPLPTHERLQLT